MKVGRRTQGRATTDFDVTFCLLTAPTQLMPAGQSFHRDTSITINGGTETHTIALGEYSMTEVDPATDPTAVDCPPWSFTITDPGSTYPTGFTVIGANTLEIDVDINTLPGTYSLTYTVTVDLSAFS